MLAKEYPIRLKIGGSEIQMTWGVAFILVGGAGMLLVQLIRFLGGT